jgi:hypothetical protein
VSFLSSLSLKGPKKAAESTHNPSKKYECFLSRWGGQSDDVFTALEGDFMKPRISEVRRVALKKL